MSPKAPWLALSALILIASALFLLLRTGEASPPEAGGPLREDQTTQAGDPMVADGGVEAPAADAQTPVERQQIETPSEPDHQVAVLGRLVGPDGNPVPDLPVEMALDRGVPRELPAGQREETTSGSDGRFSYRVTMGQGGTLRVPGQEWVLSSGSKTFRGSNSDIDVGDLEVVAASVVAGTVLDPAGQPVAGVQVLASRGRVMGIGDVGGRMTATTDAGGKFRIPGLRPGDYNLRTASPAFLPRVEDIALGAGERREDMVLRLERGQAIAGQVVDDLGRPVPGINVGSRRRSSPAAGVTMERFTPGEATVSDDNGLFTLAGLEGDNVTIRAWGEGYDEATEAEVAIGTSNLVLQVRRLAVIVGTLIDDAGTPIAGSRVRASLSRGRNGAMDMAFMAVEGPVAGSGTVTTDENGKFRLEGIRPGLTTVRATGGTHQAAERANINVAPGSVVDGVRLIAVRGTTLIVQVVDNEGQPVPDANVVVTAVPERGREGGAMEGGGGRRVVSRDVRIEERDGERIVIGDGREIVVGRARTDSEGMATIAGLRAGGFVVKATHTDLVTGLPRPVSLPPSGTVTTSISMAPGGFADLVVVDAAGQPMPGARYIVSGPARMPQPGEHPGRTDGAGAARIGPLAPGSYSAILQLQAPGRAMGPGMFVSLGDNRTLDESRVDFEVRSGETTSVELAKPLLTTFVGTVFDADGPVAGATVQLRRKAEDGDPMARLALGGTFQATSESDGSFLIEDLSAGTYTVSYGRPTQLVKAEMELEFAAGQPEERRDLRLAGGTLRVTVMSQDRGGPVANAKVEVVRPSAGGEERREVVMMAVRVEPGAGSPGETMTMEMGGRGVVTDDEGVAVIDAVPPGQYSLKITHSDHIEYVVSDQVVRDGSVTDAGIASLALGGTVSGKITSEISEAMICEVEYKASDGGEPQLVTARRGVFRLEGLRPGKYKLRARDLLLTQLGKPSRWGDQVEIEIKAGQVATVNLYLPVPH